MTNSKQLTERLKHSFGSAVRTRRHRMGISQDELAWRATVHRTYVTNVERGICNPSLNSIAKIARALETSASVLLADVEAAINPSRPQSPETPVDILLVEDSPNDIELTVHGLKNAGLANTVDVARDGAEALDYFFGPKGTAIRGTAHPSLVLLDLNLPKHSGIEVLRRLKSDKRTDSIPVVVLTASRTDRDMNECRRLGVNAYIVKPVNFRNLSEVTPRLNLCWLLLRNPLRAAA